jgi:KaiC/GvpD/RAD55 family RecA-like ATPase
VIHQLRLGAIQVVARPPAILWEGAPDVAVLKTKPIGFAGASEADRSRWISSFRRLLDGLDGPLQVIIEVHPGTGSDRIETSPVPFDFDEMRHADTWFVEHIAASELAHCFETSVVTSTKQQARLESALQEMGVGLAASVATADPVFGTERQDCLLHPGGFTRTWYIERLPGTELVAGWLYRLLPPGLKLSLSWHASPLPVAWIIEYLQRQLINMRAARLQNAEAGIADPSLAGALPNAEDLQRRLAASQDKAFHVAVYLSLTSPTRRELESGAEKIESAARAVLCEIEPCTFRMLDGFLATRPGGIDRLGRRRVLDTSALVTFFPWLEADLQQPGGTVIGRNRATGAPVLFDPFDQQCYANANIAVFGHSGAGKTYLLSAIAMGALGRGTQVYVMDPEHEYGRLATQLGGIDVQLALGSGHALNVLDLRPSDRRDESWLGTAAADAVDLCVTICGGLDEPERALVEGAVRAAYRDVEQPVLRDVARALPKDTRVATILGRWVNGSLGQMFSAPTNVDLEAPIVAFGMRELREEMVAPVHFLLAEALWSRIKRKDQRRMLVVDELGLLFEDATIRRFVVSLARRIRKYNGSLVFATQNPGDLLSSDQGSVVATNPALVFFGAQRPGEAAKLQDAFHLSRHQRSFLESARRGEFILAAGSERLAVQVQAPPWQEEVMRLARAAARPPP